MQIKPIKQKMYRVPCYPNRNEIELNRFLLENQPRRWQKVPLTAAVLSTTMMLGLTGCSLESELGFRTEGIGGIPVKYMLTEDDAFVAISSEFKNIGYTVERDGGTVQNVQLFPNSKSKKKAKELSIQLDYIVKDKNIKMEFVSESDINYMENNTNRYYSELWESERRVAKRLKEALNESDPDSNFGTFYDPGTEEGTNGTYDKTEALNKVRKQVKSFIEWLQAEGVI